MGADRCEHGVWLGDHCYQCELRDMGLAQTPRVDVPRLIFSGPRVALAVGDDPAEWEWHEYDPIAMGWRPIKHPNVQTAFRQPSWDELSDAEKAGAARLAVELGICKPPR